MKLEFILPEDADMKTALAMLEIFKTKLNELIILHNVITPEGRVTIKGEAICSLTSSIINLQKQLRLDRAFEQGDGK